MRSNTHDASGTRAAKRAGDTVIRKALRELETRARQPGILLNSFSVAANWFRLKLGESEHEIFAAAWLDNRRRLIAFEELFRGSLDRTAVYAREIVKAALRKNAAAVLFAHNHPSGSVTASGDDLALTLELSRALDLVDVHVLARARSLRRLRHGRAAVGMGQHGFPAARPAQDQRAAQPTESPAETNDREGFDRPACH
jgi:DNA repair protein RadC